MISSKPETGFGAGAFDRRTADSGHAGAAIPSMFGAYSQALRHGAPVVCGAEYRRMHLVSRDISRAASVVVERDRGDTPGYWGRAELPAFDADVLGRTVARIRDVFLLRANRGGPVLADSLACLLGDLHGRGVGIVLADAWSGEEAFRDALRTCGFSRGATRLRWVRGPAAAGTGLRLRTRFGVRPARASDLARLLPLAGRFGPGQYAGVRGIDPADTERFYARWMERAWSGEFADEVLVADGRNGPCAFASFGLRQDLLNLTGRRIMGGGLAAVAPGSEGALIALMREMMARVDGGEYDGAEFDMYEGNSAALRCLQAFGFAHVDTACVMHFSPAGELLRRSA